VGIREILEQHGVDVGDREAVYRTLLALPIAGRSRVALWAEYLSTRGEQMTDAEREALSA
jgi:hypothetical protein